MFLKASASPPLPHDVIVLKESESIKRNQGNNRIYLCSAAGMENPAISQP